MASAEHVVLVSGGSRGIGAAVCRRLAREGVAVLIAARGREASAALAEEILGAGGLAWPLELDVADPQSIASAVRAAREIAADVGPLDWLVNNAGIAESSPLLPRNGSLEENDAFVRRHMDVNFHGARLLIEELVPGMKEHGYGRVVNLASSAGLRGYAYVAAYCASKFALVGYTLAAAEELNGSGVTVNAVCPYYVDSPMLDRTVANLVKKTGQSEEQLLEFFRGQNPGGKLLTIDQVVDAVAYLLFGDANGVLLELDGSDVIQAHHPNRSEAPS